MLTATYSALLRIACKPHSGAQRWLLTAIGLRSLKHFASLFASLLAYACSGASRGAKSRRGERRARGKEARESVGGGRLRVCL
jgi:hypothetical protein